MSVSRPSISVCVATYNGERFIGEQLASILASPLVDEVIVSDDGSTDSTMARVAAIGDRRIRARKGPGRGIAANFESMLRDACGDYIFLSDQDDIWLPGKVEIMCRTLESVALAVSDCVVVDSDRRVLHDSLFAVSRSGPGLLKNLARPTYIGCCMAMRRDLLRWVLPFPAHIPVHDWWIGLVADSLDSVHFVERRLVQYRRHGANVSSTAGMSRNPVIRRVAWRFRVATALVLRRMRGPYALLPGRSRHE